MVEVVEEKEEVPQISSFCFGQLPCYVFCMLHGGMSCFASVLLKCLAVIQSDEFSFLSVKGDIILHGRVSLVFTTLHHYLVNCS